MSEILDLGQGRVARQKTPQRLGALADKSIEPRHLSQGVLDLIPAQSANIYDAIVGSQPQIDAGQATHTTLQAAHDAIPDGSSILILKGTFSGAAQQPL